MLLTPLGQKIVVRYARKPIWMPTARSKLFRIPEHTFYSQEEVEQIKTLHTAYKAQVYSLNQFMKHEFFIPASQSGGLPPDFVAKEMEKDKLALTENDQENARVAKIRESALNQRVTELELTILKEKEVREQRLIEDAQFVDDYVNNLEADSESFITPDNIEAMIEKAIANPVSFEYAIDPRGRKLPSYTSSKTKEIDRDLKL